MSNTVTSFVLAGGKSSRFGSNKSLADFGGTPMVQRVADNLREAFGTSPRLLGADDSTMLALEYENYQGPREGNGPLSAMLDAFEIAESEFVAFAPNDTPNFLSSDFEKLFREISQDNAQVVVASDAQEHHRRHWLLSVWRKNGLIEHLSSQYSLGIRSVHEAVVGLHIQTVMFEPSKLLNVNYVSDMTGEGTI